MRRLIALALALAVALGLGAGIAAAQGVPTSFPGTQPLVLALYYPWYDEGAWDSGVTADRPLIPYASWHRETVERHVGWAKDAGIDVLVSAWFGPRDNNPTENNLKTLLDVAQPAGLKLAILLETDSGEFFPTRASLVTALKHALATHASHPAYLRVDGRPVIFVWRPSAVFGPNGARVNQRGAPAVAAWRALLDEVDPARQAVWIGEGDDFSILDVFDGIFPYSIAWAADPASQLASYGGKVRAYNGANGTAKRWIATAMPGYDDTRIPGRGKTFAVDRAGGSYYERTFQGAIASGPDWVMISSFNEWLEGHQIEPSASYGMRFLELTRTLSDAFRLTASTR
ncbi:MAG: glycoside hydrolase family 99-like domain-containing protein [Chloroflexi bacterium]|nr:glycoside hydrolase family 99-like domain-containing protein [Chloroflexota bacterium]